MLELLGPGLKVPASPPVIWYPPPLVMLLLLLLPRVSDFCGIDFDRPVAVVSGLGSASGATLMLLLLLLLSLLSLIRVPNAECSRDNGRREILRS